MNVMMNSNKIIGINNQNGGLSSSINDEMRIKCNVCGRSFKNKHSLSQHKSRYHPNIMNPNDNDNKMNHSTEPEKSITVGTMTDIGNENDNASSSHKQEKIRCHEHKK